MVKLLNNISSVYPQCQLILIHYKMLWCEANTFHIYFRPLCRFQRASPVHKSTTGSTTFFSSLFSFHVTQIITLVESESFTFN